MTRRERLEAKAEKRREWAGKAEARSAARFDTAHKLVEGIPLGQPILVGHHSEKAHRRTLDRMGANMTKGCEEADLAKHHAGRADGIEDQLARSIFSDDEDAAEQLEAKAQRLELQRDRRKAFNALWRKAGKPAGAAPGSSEEELAAWTASWERLRVLAVEAGYSKSDVLAACSTLARFPYYSAPFPSYVFSNLGARIRDARQRIVDVERRQAKAALAEAVGGVLVLRSADGTYCSVTFAEKPSNRILDALREAGFHWAGGSWNGYSEKLPAGIEEAP